MITSVFDRVLPVNNKLLTPQMEEQHYQDLRYLLIASTCANLFFGIITVNPYLKVLRFTLCYGSAFLFEELKRQRTYEAKLDYKFVTFSYLYLSISKAFLFLAQAYQFVIAFCAENIRQGIQSGAYAIYYLRKSVSNAFEYTKLFNAGQKIVV